MASKVTPEVLERLKVLKYKQNLTDKVISMRLGISERTVRIYTRAARTGAAPYEAPSSELNVSPNDHPEAAEQSN